MHIDSHVNIIDELQTIANRLRAIASKMERDRLSEAQRREQSRRVKKPEPARERYNSVGGDRTGILIDTAAPAPERPGTERVVKSLLLAKQQNKNDGWDQTSGMNFDEAIRRVRAHEEVREWCSTVTRGHALTQEDVARKVLALLDATADREGGTG